MSAKSKVMDLIRKKQRSMKSNKEKFARKIGVNIIVLQFFKDFDNLRARVDSPAAFNAGLEYISNTLNSRIAAIDAQATIKVQWNREHDTVDWENLSLEAVHIIWSDTYIRNNPHKEKEVYIDMLSLLLEGSLEKVDNCMFS